MSSRKKQKVDGSNIVDVLTGGKLVNFYEHLPKEFKANIDTYPNYKKMRIQVPFQSIVVSRTGGGKTNIVFNIMSAVNCFDRIWLFTKNPDEPLYAWLINKLRKLEEKFKREIITVSNDISTFPDVGEIGADLADKKARGLLIVDDFVNANENELRNVQNAWIAGRKAGTAPGEKGGGLSCIFISQSYFRTPKVIRENSQLIFLGQLASTQDLKRIVAEYSLDVSANQLVQMHQYVMKQGPMNFLTIDLYNTNDKHLKYRNNFAPLQ